MFPVVHSMGNQSKMRGDSEHLSMESSCCTTGEGDDSFLPPIDSRWSDTNVEISVTEMDDDESHDEAKQGSTEARRQGEKKLSGRFIVNKSSMSDSFVLPNISNYSSTDSGLRKSRTAGSNWSHGGEATRTRNGFPMSKSCPILKNRNGYQWGKDSSEEDDDDDLDGDFLSMSYNVMMQSERLDDVAKTNRLVKLETNSRPKKSGGKGTTSTPTVPSLGDTKLPDIFCQSHDRSPRNKDDNNNGDRRRPRKDAAQRKGKIDAQSPGQEMDYELDVSPWRGGEQPEDGVDKSENSKPKAKRKAAGRKLPLNSKNPDSKCRDWLQESHR